MQFRIKIVLFLIVNVSCSFFITNAFAQIHPFNSPFVFFVNPYNTDKKAPVYNNKHTFQVVLRDSSKLEVDSKIWHDVVLHKNYILYVDRKIPKSDPAHRERKIYPDETVSISRMGEDSRQIDVLLLGSPKDSCWMFKTITGTITAYSYLSEQNDMFNPITIVGIQKDDGEIEAYNPKNLQQMLLGDYDALKYFDNEKYIDAIKRYNKDAKKAAKK